MTHRPGICGMARLDCFGSTSTPGPARAAVRSTVTAIPESTFNVTRTCLCGETPMLRPAATNLNGLSYGGTGRFGLAWRALGPDEYAPCV